MTVFYSDSTLPVSVGKSATGEVESERLICSLFHFAGHMLFHRFHSRKGKKFVLEVAFVHLIIYFINQI